MRELSLEELELIAGTSGTGTTSRVSSSMVPPSQIPKVPVVGHLPYPPPPQTSTSGGPPPPLPPCEPMYAPANRVDLNQIAINEGGYKNYGYHPTNNSGLTISAGVDLKFKDTAFLNSSGISQAAKDALTPFLGKYGSDVDTLLATNGKPYISDGDMYLLFNAAATQVYNHISTTYSNAAAANGMNVQFSQLPEGAQTALFDAAYQYWNVAGKSPLWPDATTGKWSNVVQDFLNMYTGPDSTDRHTSDASAVQNDINYRQLPDDANSVKCP